MKEMEIEQKLLEVQSRRNDAAIRAHPSSPVSVIVRLGEAKEGLFPHIYRFTFTHTRHYRSNNGTGQR